MGIEHRGAGVRVAAASSLALLAVAADAQPAAPDQSPLASGAQPAAASPAPIWQDVTSLGVTCLVHTPRGVETGALHDRVCAAVRAQAAKGAPVPVEVAAIGGAALAPGRVTLLVHANVERVGGAEVMALTLRPFRNAAGAGQFFGARPRVVAAGDVAALDRAVAALLAETLPWQAPARGGPRRPLPPETAPHP